MVGKTDGEGSRVPLEQLSAELRRASVTLRIREQELFFCRFLMKTFFLVFTTEFLKICAYFAMKTFVLWSTLSNSKE